MAWSIRASRSNKDKTMTDNSMIVAEEVKNSEMGIDLTAEQKKQLEQVVPMWKIVWNQFCEHKPALLSLITIVVFLITALSAPLIQSLAGLDPDAQNPLDRYKPPFSTAELSSDQREDRVLQYINRHPDEAKGLQEAVIQKSFVTPVRPDDALYDFANKDLKEALTDLKTIPLPAAAHFSKVVKGFQTFHIFGTDELGRDVFIRLIYGARVSMGVGLLVAISSALIGFLVGALAGFYGGWVDMSLMRFTDALLALPVIPFLIVLAAIDMNKIPFFHSVVGTQNESVVKMVTILVLFSWMQVALLVRGSILSLREREFILASKTLGAKDSTIIFRHMLPNAIAPILVSVTLGVGNAILFESALSFLGLGIQPPTPSWGNMLFNAQELITEAPFLAFLPGFMILITTIAFNYLGDGIQDAIDPKALRR
jgi:peptide/nickel transport system permease protein